MEQGRRLGRRRFVASLGSVPLAAMVLGTGRSGVALGAGERRPAPTGDRGAAPAARDRAGALARVGGTVEVAEAGRGEVGHVV